MPMRRAKGPWFGGYLEAKRSQKKSTSYSIKSTNMKRKSLIEAVSPEVRDFIEAGTPKPQFVQTQPEKGEGEASPAVIPEPGKTVIDPAEKKQIPVPVPVVHQPADEIPSPVLVPQTFRLPQRLIEDLARAAIERKIKRRRPWSQQDIVAEAIKEWLRKHVSK
jgi:hypothetical protein